MAVAYTDLDADDRLMFNQTIRHDVAVALTHNEAGERVMPTDKDSVYMLMTVLKDSDGTELKRRKLNIDNRAAEADALAATVLAKLADRISVTSRGDQHTGTNTGYMPKVDPSALAGVDLDMANYEKLGNEVDLDEINRLGREHYKGKTQD